MSTRRLRESNKDKKKRIILFYDTKIVAVYNIFFTLFNFFWCNCLVILDKDYARG